MSAPVSAAWIVEALIASTLLMGAVLLLRGRVRRWFGPQVAYALWALPALRLVLPPVPASWREVAATPISAAGETIIVMMEPVATAAAPVAVASEGPSLALIALGVWGAGSLAFLIWHVLSHRNFCRRLLGAADLVEERDGVAVIASDAAAGPLAFGIRRRFVAFPRDFAERYDAEERELALAHELGHHARGDLVANWAALVVLAVHWANPIAWRAFRAFRADQELANDARVLAGRSRAARHAYACAIVKAAHGGAVSAACHLHTIEDLKGRLKMLTTSRFSRRRLAGGVATVSLLGMIGLGLTVSGSQAAAAITETVTEPIELAQVATPTPPTPPAAVATPAAPEAPRRVKRITVVKDGKTTTYEGAEADAYAAANDLPLPPAPPLPPHRLTGPDGKHVAFLSRRSGPIVVPNVSQRVCRDNEGAPGSMTVNGEKDGRKFVIVCSNRIDAVGRDAGRRAAFAERNARFMEKHAEAMAANAEKMAENAERMGLNSTAIARSSLTSARATIAADRNLTDDQRREALAGIDQAMAELNDPANR